MLACVFPGQGSQSLGMLDAWAAEAREIQETLADASIVLNYDLAALLTEGPAEQLNQTEVTQPAMLAADIAIWRAWQARSNDAPTVLAGHSLGEYAALVAAGVLNFSDALGLVQDRARWMQQAVAADAGGMAAVVGLTDEQVAALCASQAQGQVLEPVNYNAPGQVVVAGEKAAVDRLLGQAKAAGARMAKALPVSVPAHSSLMQGVADKLRARFDEVDWQAPNIPVLQNINAEASTDPGQIREALAQQVCSPVQWVRTLNSMREDYDISSGIECGPGQVLCGLAKRTLKGVPFVALGNPENLNSITR